MSLFSNTMKLKKVVSAIFRMETLRSIFFLGRGSLCFAAFSACLFFACLLVEGCAVGPKYQHVPTLAPPAWKEQPPWRVADPKDAIPKGNWWSIFTNKELDGYESQAMASNQTLEISRHQLEQARASVRISQSGLYPQANADPIAERSRVSGNRPTFGNVTKLAPVTQNNFSVPVTVSWEADLFGGIRRGAESANALYQVSAANLENVRLVIASEVATDYFTLRELDDEIAVVDSAVDYQEKGLKLVQSRHDGGIASGLDVAQQETLLNSTRTQATLLRQQRSQFEHAIASLVGAPASLFSIPVSPQRTAPPVVPLGLPTDVLERRPDIAAAERQMASQNALIGVAQSAFYPSLGILGSGGLNSGTFSKLFNAPSFVWALGADLAQPILNGGRLRAQLDFAKAGYQGSVAGYRQTVLTAFQEVEDGISGLAVLSKAAETQQQAVEAARRALQIANDRYVGGLVTYLDVITAQENLLDNERLATQILGQRLVTSVGLVKALGGGWDASSLQAIHVSPTLKEAIQP